MANMIEQMEELREAVRELQSQLDMLTKATAKATAPAPVEPLMDALRTAPAPERQVNPHDLATVILSNRTVEFARRLAHEWGCSPIDAIERAVWRAVDDKT